MKLLSAFPIFLFCFIIDLNGVHAKLQDILNKIVNSKDSKTFEDGFQTKLQKRTGHALSNQFRGAALTVAKKQYNQRGSTLDKIKSIRTNVENKIDSIFEPAGKMVDDFFTRIDKMDSIFTVLNNTLRRTIWKHLGPIQNATDDIMDDLEVAIEGWDDKMDDIHNETMSPFMQKLGDGFQTIVSDSLSDDSNSTLETFVVDLTNLIADTFQNWTEKAKEDVRNGAEPFENKIEESFGIIRARLIPNITLANSADKTKYTIPAILVSFTVIALLFILVPICLFWYRRRFTVLTKEDVESFRRGNKTSDSVGDDTTSFDCLEFPSQLEISRSRLILLNVLGQGNFGVVYNAKFTQADGMGSTSVAVKKINRPDCSKESFKSVLSELKVLCYVGSHLHIIEIVGAYIEEIGRGLVYIATVLCENGSLADFLRRADARLQTGSTQTDLINVTPNLYELSRYSHEIALGMEYLSNKNIIHGDLSTRNVLLDSNYVCKIGDFGMSRKLNKYQILYQKTKKGASALPWRWLAIESLKRLEFSTKSDVWSYGITLWEIYTLGEVPYPNHSFTKKFIEELENGIRMSAPTLSTNEIYLEMTRCWDINPQLRPSFKELSSFFASTRSLIYTPIGL